MEAHLVGSLNQEETSVSGAVWSSGEWKRVSQVGRETRSQGLCGSYKRLNCNQGVGDFPGGSDSKASAYNVGDLCSIPGSGRFPAGWNGNPLQYSCLDGWRSLVGYSPWGLKELDTTERLHFHFLSLFRVRGGIFWKDLTREFTWFGFYFNNYPQYWVKQTVGKRKLEGEWLRSLHLFRWDMYPKPEGIWHRKQVEVERTWKWNEGLSGKDLSEMKASLWTQAGSDDSTQVHSWYLDNTQIP